MIDNVDINKIQKELIEEDTIIQSICRFNKSKNNKCLIRK